MEQLVFQKHLEALFKEEQFSGVVRVTVKDRILFEGSWGDADHEKQLPFTPGSMFTLYSMTKAFCALGMMTLVDKGLVDLDAHPAAYVPECAGLPPKVTVRQLLQHTGGLGDLQKTVSDQFATGQPEELREQLKVFSQHPLLFEPGTDGFYCNTNFILCALIMENVTGTGYARYMQEAVFDPLGAKTLTVDSKNRRIPARVQGYCLIDGVLTPVEAGTDWMYGAGDLVGSVDDVYCLNKAIKHRLLLKMETWEQVLTPSKHNNKGFGCTVTQWHGLHRIVHNGGHRGFRSFHVQLPEDDVDVIILSNHGFGSARQQIVELVYRWLYDETAQAEKPMLLDYGIL